MRLNPGGTVPTLVHNGHAVPETIDIARYVDANFPGPPLIPGSEPERAEMERWLAKMYEFSMRELSYSNEKLIWLGSKINGFRLRNLKKRERKHPDMTEIYRAKYKDMEDFANNASDPSKMEAMRTLVRSAFDEMEETLGKNPWLAGEQYSLADVFWTVAVARFVFLGFRPLEGHPALTDWYDRVKARPSFQTADIWETFRFSKILPILAQQLGPRLALGLVVIGALAALAWWVA